MCETATVALRKESVDRNICSRTLQAARKTVALRKESVDRNLYSAQLSQSVQRRSPQGERG